MARRDVAVDAEAALLSVTFRQDHRLVLAIGRQVLVSPVPGNLRMTHVPRLSPMALRHAARWRRRARHLGQRAVWVLVVVVAVGFTVGGRLANSHGDLAQYANWANIIALSVALVGITPAFMPLRSVRDDTTREQLREVLDRIADEVLREAQRAWLAQLDIASRQPEAINVRFTRQRGLRHAGGGEQGDLSTVLAYYRQLRPGRLVIVGTSGAGKSTLARKLLIDLLEQRAAARDGAAPVPIWCSLTPLRAQASFDQWLANQLTVQFELSQDVADRLVARGQILPILDGLDELVTHSGETIHAAEMVGALNRYLRGTGRGNLVLTCREECYEELPEPLIDATVVVLADLDRHQISDYIERAATNLDQELLWLPVLNSLCAPPMGDPSGPELLGALRTPWHVTFAFAACGAGELRPAALLTYVATGKTLCAQLTPAYVNAICERPRQRYRRSESVRRWLATLAGRRTWGRDIVVHNLWHVAGNRLVRLLHLAAAIPAALLLTVALFQLLRDTPHAALGTVGLLAVAGLIALGLIKVAIDRTSTPMHPDYRRLLATRTGRYQLGVSFLASLLTAQFAVHVRLSVLNEVLAGAVAGILSGLAFGGCLGMLTRRTETSLMGAVRPADPFQSTFRGALVAGLSVDAVLVTQATASGFSSLQIVFGGVFPVVFSIIAGLPIGSVAWQRYVIAVALTASRRRLPVRPIHFLKWGVDTGLFRTAGIAYQFRHLELQEALVNDVPHQALPSEGLAKNDGAGFSHPSG